jgi:predicted transcriptional regulator
VTTEIVCGFREYAETPWFGCIAATSEEATSKIVTELGLSSSQTKIYLTLAKEGKLSFEHISDMLRIDETEVCRAILRLQKLGLVYIENV